MMGPPYLTHWGCEEGRARVVQLAAIGIVWAVPALA